MTMRSMTLTLTGAALATGVSLAVLADSVSPENSIIQADRATGKDYARLVEMGFPAPRPGELVHVPPTLEDLDAAELHPELKQVIRRGYDLFTNTQQLRGENVFNDMNCSSCHLGEGRMPFSGPIWPAAVTLPDFRGKNQHVNSLEERIAGCFAYSMNGTPPAYGSDDMLALAAYHQWLAKGVPMYPDQPIYGRGFPRLADPEQAPDYARGEQVYLAQCAICHSEDGSGLYQDGAYVFPPPWGDGSNNWGAGISRTFTMASFVKHNMPLGQPMRLSDQEAWDVALYMSSQERPQDPRYTGDVRETRARFESTFHAQTLYGTEREHDGVLLGDHANTGERGEVRPWNIGVPRFEALKE